VLVRIGCFGRLADGETLGRGVASLAVIVGAVPYKPGRGHQY
jgi:hypothetical protein